MAKVLGLVALLFFSFAALSHSGSGQYFLELKASNKYERSEIANSGFAIEEFHENHVVVTGSEQDKAFFKAKGQLLSFSHNHVSAFSFPPKDSEYHDHLQILAALDQLQQTYPDLVQVTAIGMSVEGRIIPVATLTVNPETHLEKPGVVFMGAHHAREHLSAEVPLRHLMKFCELYSEGDERVKRLL
ncbi:MAG: hypothetical protein HRT45_19595, partial [Bdellovibrionales bacterium]|nr:hypothetical protein [Bdellovibrionales bacterium]